MEKLKELNFKMLFIYVILTFFIIPRSLQDISKIVFVMIFFFINAIYLLANRLDLKVKIKEFGLFFIILQIYLLIIMTTPYSIIFTSSNLIFLIIAYMSIGNKPKTVNLNYIKNTKIIYIICIISIIVQIYLGKYYTINGNNSLAIIGDKNYSGVVAILFLMYCDKNKFKFGKLVAIIVILLVDSRASLMMLILFYITKIFRGEIYSILCKLRLNKSKALFVIMFIFTISFSYFWIESVASRGINDYQQGLNDESNKTRFASNIYAFEELKNNRMLFIYGYDEDFDKVAGIDAANVYEHTRFKGVRLVQPHNSILNVVVKSGIAFSLVYFCILSNIIDNRFDKYNIEYIIPYLVNCLFLHRLLDSKFLLFWILILYMPSLSHKYRSKKLKLKIGRI